MSNSILFLTDESNEQNPALLVESVHTPDSLASASGVYISASGSAMLQVSRQKVLPSHSWLWFASESGKMTLTHESDTVTLKGRDCCMVPPEYGEISLNITEECRVFWMTLSGTLANEFMLRMGAVPHRMLRQGVLPTQMNLARNIVQATVRLHDVQESSSAQLQQLLWGMLATHCGQPVSKDAVLSHEIAKVIDAMRRNQYRDNFSLSDMAALSRMPVETFRKRFVSEVGMPPQSYQLFCKMERAKALLKQGHSVRQSGTEVGMSDPYHFSKAFKNVVGVSPSAYSKTALK